MSHYRFADLEAEYSQLWRNMRIRPERSADVDKIARKLLANKARYQRVSQMVGAPWYLIAAIHQRESSPDFARHLHEGSPLTDRTKNVPKGRPATGQPPFSWEESAIDALTVGDHDMRHVGRWTIERICYEAEKYNGYGYRNQNLPSAYVWSYSTNYLSGKYVSDGHFDPHAIDQQCGVMPIIKRLAELDRTINIGGPGSDLVFVPDWEQSHVMPIPAPEKEDAFARVILGSLFSRHSAQAPNAGAPAPPKILSPIDKFLGGEALAGNKTTLAIGAYALLSILEATGTANAHSPTSEIMTTLIASLGGLGVLAKIDRAVKAISIIAAEEGR